MTYTMGAFDKLNQYIKIEVCCEKLSKIDLERICKEGDEWWAGGEGQNYYQMFFCPFCGSRLP